MGGAFYGLSDDDGALNYNPAGLARIRNGARFNLLGVKMDLVPETISAAGTIADQGGKNVQVIADALVKYQGKPLYGSVGLDFLSYVGKNFGIGLMLAEPKLNFAILGAGLDTSLEATLITDSGAFVGYAHSFMEDTLHVGLSLKGIVRGGGRKTFSLLDIAQKNSFQIDPAQIGGTGFGMDVDLGGTYQLPLPQMGPWLQTHVSLVFSNLLASQFDLIKINGGKVPGLNRMVTLAGHAVFAGWGPFDNFHALVDFSEFAIGGETDPHLGARGGSFWKHVNLGVEAPMNGWFAPRLGIHQGYLTAGFGINARVVQFDVATYVEELASGVGRLGTRRFQMRLALGWGGAPPAPLSGTKYETLLRDDEKKNLTPMELDQKKKDAKASEATVDPQARKPQGEGEPEAGGSSPAAAPAVEAVPEATTTTPPAGESVTIPNE